MIDPIIVALAFAAGFVVRRLGYPPLIGYLLVGFVAAANGLGDAAALEPLADAGILLLLFTIGLKLNIRQLAPRYVWGSAILHMLIVVPLTAAVLKLAGLWVGALAFEAGSTAWVLAFALSFSSTVLAMKLFEERGEIAAFHASIAIGILVIQDVMAVIWLVAASGYWPSPWALLLLLLPLLRWPLAWIYDRLGHGELLLLSGVLACFGGAALFEVVHLKDGLGALCAGALIAAATPAKAKELYEQLVGVKNLLLIGFFLQIGYYGLPSASMMIIALVLVLLLILRPVIYFSLSVLFGLRARTGALSGLALASYSEFGLIVAAIAVESGRLQESWLVTLALAIALSFMISTPINKQVNSFYRRLRPWLKTFEKPERLPEEYIEPIGDARIAILGMGRVGRKAYETLSERDSRPLVGIEENYRRCQTLKQQGFVCVHGDATDRDFWERTALAELDMLLVGLSNHRENVLIVQLAREMQFKGELVVVARFPDQQRQIEALGAKAFYLYGNVGRAFAEHALDETRPSA